MRTKSARKLSQILSGAIQDVFAPTTTFADDVLHFPNKDVHYRSSVRYYDFKGFGSRVTIVEIGQPL